MARQELTLSQSVDGFLATKAGHSRNYVSNVRTVLGSFVRIATDMQMRSLTEDHVNAVFDRWREMHSPSTYNKALGLVRNWLIYAHRRRQLRLSPDELTAGVSTRRVVPRQKLYLSAAELLALLDKARHPRDRAYLALAMNTALRASEVVTLKLEDVDLDSGSLYVLRHKTGTRDIMPITSDLDQELRRWLRFYTEHVGVLKGSYYLVPAKQKPNFVGGGRPFEREHLEAVTLQPEICMGAKNAVMRTLLNQAGYPIEREGLHTIRRSIARVSFEHFTKQGDARDEALAVVQATLGHATQAITERYIGVERFRDKRDKVMRNRPFLSAMIENDESNIRRLHG